MICLLINNFEIINNNLVSKLIMKVVGQYLPPFQNMIANYFTYMSSIVTARSSVLNFSTALFLMFLEHKFDIHISTKISMYTWHFARYQML